MKFISFALLSALATLTTSAPAPSQCVPEQGTKYSYDYDVAGWYRFDHCTWDYLQFESGVLKTKGAYNFVDNHGSTYTYCSKHHSHIAGGKAVDAQGNRYNVMEVSNGNYDSTYDAITYAHKSDDKYQSKYKFVGHGALANAVFTFTYNCHSSWDPVTGYQRVCKKDDYSFKCS